MTQKSLIERLRKTAVDHEKFEQGGGASGLLYEAADALENIIAASRPVLERAEDWYDDRGASGDSRKDEDFIRLHQLIDGVQIA